MKPIVKKISHASFSCFNLQRTCNFYKKFFRFKKIHIFKTQKNKEYGAILKINGRNFLEFFNAPKKQKKNDIPTLFRHICFETNNIKQVKKIINKFDKQAIITRGRTDKTLQIWTQDPNGIKIEFHQYDKKSKLR